MTERSAPKRDRRHNSPFAAVFAGVMRGHKRLPALLLACCLALLMSAQASSASFSKPRPLDGSTGAVGATLAADPRAGAVAAWLADRDGGDRVRIARIDRRGRPGRTASVRAIAEVEPTPDVAVRPDHSAVVAWQSGDGVSPDAIRATVVGPDDVPGPMLILDSGASADVRAPRVLIDSGGRAIVVWDSVERSAAPLEERAGEIRWLRLLGDGSPDGPVRTIPITSPVDRSGLQLAIDRKDRVTAVWRTLAHRVGHLRFGLDGTAGTERMISNENRFSLFPQVVVDARGVATVVWSSQRGRDRIEAVRVGADGAPGDVFFVSRLNPSNRVPQPVIDAAGRVTVVWMRVNRRSRGRIVSARISPAGKPGAITKLSPKRGLSTDPAAVVGRRDRIAAVWKRRARGRGLGLGKGRIQTRWLRPTGALGVREKLGRGIKPTTVADGRGRPVIVWRGPVAGRSRLLIARAGA